MSSPGLQQLLRVLSDRDLGHHDVAQAFESQTSRSGIEQWANEYLNSETLLTKEELTFRESNAFQTLSTEPSPGLYVSDESLELAIASLEASTASIERQARLLEAQKRTIEDIIRRNNSSKGEQSDRSESAKRSAQEKAQLEFEQIELCESLQSQLELSTKQVNGVTANIPSNVERILEKDDRLLEGLEKILPRLSETTATSASFDNVDRLCKALVRLTSQDIRMQIEAAYSNAMRTHGSHINGTHSDDDQQAQKESLQAELNELCREIDGLSTMAVDTQYRMPITQALHVARDEANLEKTAWSEYVISVLKYLTTRLETMDEHFQQAHDHSAALRNISTALETVVAPNSTAKKPASAMERSPAKRIDQKGLKPLKLVQANLSENQDPVVQLLRGLDVRVSNPGDSSELEEKLAAVAEEQQKKLSTFEAATEESLTDQIARSLTKADMDVQAVLGAVHAHSPFGTVRLVDKDVQDAAERLEESTKEVDNEMRASDVEQIGSSLKKTSQVLLQKWKS